MREEYKPWPDLNTDEEAEDFVANSDLTEYDWSKFKKVHFEFTPKREQLCLDIPDTLLAAVKAKAREKELSYTQYIERILEQAVSQPTGL